jgi:hypothetical protein
MQHALTELWDAFWVAFKETPRGMAEPFVAFWRAATHIEGVSEQRH